jgi:hypothetical protein
VKLLLGCGEDEIGTAGHAAQRFVSIHRHSLASPAPALSKLGPAREAVPRSFRCYGGGRYLGGVLENRIMAEHRRCGAMSLRRIERELRRAIRQSSRPDLEIRLGRVGWTDDGSTVYVHLFPAPGWEAERPGDAFVLASADYAELRTCADWRALLEEARLYAEDELEKIVRWLEGR